jgi:hypothetical protein
MRLRRGTPILHNPRKIASIFYISFNDRYIAQRIKNSSINMLIIGQMVHIDYEIIVKLQPKSVFDSWAPVLPLFQFFWKSYIFISKKSENKSRHNTWRKLQAYKILIWNSLYCRLHKKIKSVKIWIFEICTPKSTRLLFLCSPEFFVFEIEILHVYVTIYWLHHDFFSNFFETHKRDFYFLKK